MSRHTWILRVMATAIAAAVLGGCARTSPDAGESARLQELEDRAQILELLTAYGATLDRRDFSAFGQLFTEDAEYGSGPGVPTRGRAAIQAQLEQVMASNPSGLPAPNFHLSFNPSIRISGDSATASSLGAYTAPDAATGATRMVFFVTYQDELARQDGRWLFKRRMIGSGPPVAPER